MYVISPAWAFFLWNSMEFNEPHRVKCSALLFSYFFPEIRHRTRRPVTPNNPIITLHNAFAVRAGKLEKNVKSRMRVLEDLGVEVVRFSTSVSIQPSLSVKSLSTSTRARGHEFTPISRLDSQVRRIPAPLTDRCWSRPRSRISCRFRF